MNTFALSHAQQRIWYTQLKYRHSPMFNTGGLVRFHGKIHIEFLRKAISAIIKGNSGLRLQFLTDSNFIARQYIAEVEVESAITYLDLSAETDPETVLKGYCESNATEPFELYDQPLYKFTILKIANDEFGYFIKLHHLISDGWSFKLLTEQIAHYYSQLLAQGELFLQEMPDYSRYVIQESESIADGLFESSRNYWLKQFEYLPDPPSLTSPKQTGFRVSYYLTTGEQEQLNNYIRKQNLSVNTFFVGVYLLYNYKKTGCTDNVVGIPLLGRSGRIERMTVGTFTNPMPFHIKIEKEWEVSVLFQTISRMLRKMYSFQKYPYDLLHKDLKLSEQDNNTLYSVSINYYNTVLPDILGDVSVSNAEFYNGEQEYPMQIILRQWDGQPLQIDIDAQTALFNPAQIDDMVSQMKILMQQIYSDDNLVVSFCTLVDEEERTEFIYSFNDTRQVYPSETLVERFYRIANDVPHRTALSHREQTLDYGQLLEQVQAAAGSLQTLGVRQGNIVAIMPEYDIESIVCILAILACGAVYNPIAGSIPLSRIKEYLNGSGATFLVTNKTVITNDIVGKKDLTVLSYSQISKNCMIADFQQPIIQPTDLAYIISTSGSTGQPKGVMIRHYNLMNYLNWAHQAYIRQEAEVFPLYSSFAFDFTLTSLFLPITTGNELRIYNQLHGDGEEANIFKEILQENKATIVKITPAHITLIEQVKVRNSVIHSFIIGGEDLKAGACSQLYRKFDAKVRIYNEYGPTEATVGCMTYLYDGQCTNDSVPIGKPIANTQIYVLDQEMKPVPVGMLGELFIGGESVAEGYLFNVEQTNLRFVHNPFLPGSVMYRTGDLAYRDKNGNLVFYGRNDHEVKIRANRVSLREIENKIMESGMVSDVIVKTSQTAESVSLYAYLIGKEDYNENNLLTFLRETLPGYMVPQALISMEMFPLTINGKVDKSKLPQPAFNCGKRHPEQVSARYISVLTAVVQELFGNCVIDPLTHFYAIGGDSIRAIQLSSMLYEKGYHLKVKDILNNPLLQEMAYWITEAEMSSQAQYVCSGPIGTIPITAWFFEQHFTDPGFYNQSVLLQLLHRTSEEDLNAAFKYLIKHHDSLRINVSPTQEMYYNEAHLDTENILEIVECGGQDIRQYVKTQLQVNFKLESDLLFKAFYLRNLEGDFIYLVIHHLCIDGVSWRILLADLQTLLGQKSRKLQLQLPQKTASVQQFAKEYAAIFKPDLEYDGNAEPVGPRCRYKDTQHIHFELDQKTTDLLFGDANTPFGTKPEELLLIALFYMLHEYYKLINITCELETHGRNFLEHPDIKRTVGWFTGVHRTKVELMPLNQENFIIYLKEYLRRSLRDGRKKNLEATNSAGIKENVIRFNYLGDLSAESGEFFSLFETMLGNDISPDNWFSGLLEVNSIKINGRLRIKLICSREMRETEFFEYRYAKTLGELTDYCAHYARKRFTPSDFPYITLTQEELDLIQETQRIEV